MNSLSDDEYVKLLTTFEIIYDESKAFDCSNCINKLAARSDRIFAQRSCKEYKPAPVNFIATNPGKVEYYTCVGNIYDKKAEQIIEIFQDYKQGTLPYPGSLMDQPAKIVEVFKLLYSLESKFQKDQAKKQKTRK